MFYKKKKFINKVSKRFNKKHIGFSPDVISLFEAYPWPGNVRQLLHEVERLVALTPEGQNVSLLHCSQELQNWKDTSSDTNDSYQSLYSLPLKIKELEISSIKNALLETHGNKRQASKILGITRQGLDKKIKRFNI